VNTTIAMITLRGLFGRRRFLLLFVLPVLLVGLTAFAASSDVPAADWAGPQLDALGLGAVVPLMALLVGIGVLGNEIDDGTIAHILAKPLARGEIIQAKLLVAVGATAAVVVPAMFLAGELAEGPSLAFGLAVGSLLAVIVYSAIFVAISVVSSRPMIIALGYVVLWEGFLGNFVGGTRLLSVRHYALSLADVVSGSDLIQKQVSLPVSLVLSGIITVGATLLAVDRLRSYQLAGETG